MIWNSSPLVSRYRSYASCSLPFLFLAGLRMFLMVFPILVPIFFRTVPMLLTGLALDFGLASFWVVFFWMFSF